RVTRPEGRLIISVSSLYDKGYGNIGEKRSVRPDRYTQTKSLHISGHKIPFHLFTLEELEREFSSHGYSLMEFGSVFRGVQPHWGLWKRFSLAERIGLLLDRFRPVEYGAMYLLVFNNTKQI
ncbi:MAG: hypothetical protein KAT35_01230, partial [Candidatus Aenigmarchaeota archaeon]|nr:hypothetical protein [Candidatus Aenigmarchaeota archaeon]